ncbi:ABC transporter permease [Phototrophicus methaneseepsis]|uniref:ABC transporter permease n=1 Tax=Phototrophicus methaneseepsis TaxID=2710758 RepID=A0A7S8E6Q5_9CHLR|nr:ABC transporter permease [Phototrophicus methaneseepsis]QPC81386.1 ABC transporter permease [Phototrophicus methaneseepsis]
MIRIILTRMWRARRLMVVLLVSMCLVNTFLALSPLYVQAIAGAEFDRRVEGADDRNLLIDVINEQPLADDVPTILRDQFGRYITDVRDYSTVNDWLCGAALAPGADESTEQNCFRPYAYQTFDELFTLIDGRLPEAHGDEGPIEVLVTPGMAAHDLIGVGSTLQIGGIENTITIVGLVDAARPAEDLFWMNQIIFAPTLTATSPVDFRTDFAFIVSPEVYTQFFLPVTSAPQYRWRAQIDRGLLSADRIPELSRHLAESERQIRDTYPSMEYVTGLRDLIASFEAALAITEGPVLLLSILVALLLLYNLTTIANLILQQQVTELALFAGRGASRLQLVGIQLVTMLLLGTVACLVGPFLARGILLLLSFAGPQAEILDAGRLGPITSNAFALSLVASAAAVIVMTLPAWSAAETSLQHLKQGAARPTKRPLWARAYLDVILIVLGILFLVRLVSLAVGADMLRVLQEPSLITQALSGRAGAAILSDPFSMLSPAFILTGLALLWMRIFPYLINLMGRALGEVGLASRLALWTVERDSGHYAQLVLVLIGTLALGTASLILSNTHTLGAWDLALQQTGADAVVTLAPGARDETVAWATLPDVQAVLPLVIVEANAAQPPHFIGVNSADVAAYDAELAQHLVALQTNAARDVGGIHMPEDTASLEMFVYAEPSDDPAMPIETRVALVMLDDNGVRQTQGMMPAEDAAPAAFYPYRLTFDVPLQGWTLLGIQFNSTRGDEEFSHVVYLDDLRAIREDGTETILLSFDEPTIEGWRWESESRQILESASLRPETAIAHDGEASLRVSYRIQRYATNFLHPQLMWRTVVDRPLSVIVSPAFAEEIGQRSPVRRTFEVGEGGATTFLMRYGYDPNIPTSAVSFNTNVTVNYEIIDIWGGWPGLSADALYMIGEQALLQQAINTRANATNAFTVNRVWLDLADRRPTDALMATLDAQDAVYSVAYAWDRYTELQREPLPNAVTGMLYAGFWVSLILSLIDFGFYLAVTIQQRSLTFATLLAMGWPTRAVVRMLLIEQAAFVVPSLVIGLLIGGVLAYLLLPLLGLLGTLALQVPILPIAALGAILIGAFVLMLWLMAGVLRRAQVATMMRFGE